MLRKRPALAAAAVLVSIVAVPAHAHEETALHALSVIERVAPEVSGISFRIVQLTQPVLVATNKTDRTLLILDEHGKPFVRMADGRIETNLRSELSYVSRDPTGRSRAPSGLDGKPRWEIVGRGDVWSWFDPRIRSVPGRTSWRVEARLGDGRISITGRFEPLEGHGHFETELIATPEVHDLEVRLLQGAVPGLYIRNETGRVLVVRGRGGEPFLRIGPSGVSGNERSPDYYYFGATQTMRLVPAQADPDSRPRWDRLSRVPIWSWLEMRARLPDRLHQRSVLGPTRRTVLTWRTPMALGGEPLALRGRVVWVPPRSTAGAAGGSARVEPQWIVLAVVLFVVTGVSAGRALARRR